MHNYKKHALFKPIQYAKNYYRPVFLPHLDFLE